MALLFSGASGWRSLEGRTYRQAKRGRSDGSCHPVLSRKNQCSGRARGRVDRPRGSLARLEIAAHPRAGEDRINE